MGARAISSGRARAVASVAVTAATALVAGLLVTIPQAAADPQPDSAYNVSLVSVLPDGSGDFASTQPGVTASDDGRYVAFIGTGGGDTDQLFVRDRQANTTSRVSNDASGAAASAPIDAAAISSTGNAVAFVTTASLVDGEPAADDTEHVYVASWPTGAITAVPLPNAPFDIVSAIGGVGVAISADGSKVAYVGRNADDSFESLVVADLTAGTAKEIENDQSEGSFAFPQISADGTVVAVIGAGCCGNSLYVFKTTGESLDNFGEIENPQTGSGSGSTDSPSPSPSGGDTGSNVLAVAPYSLSADGKFVAFDSYVADQLEPAIFGVDQNSEIPVPAGRYAGYPRLSADGRAVGYVDTSDGSAVVLGNPPDAEAGQFPVTANDGSPTDGESTIGQLTQNGNAAVFSSSATNLDGPADGSVQAYYASFNDQAAPTWADGDALSVDSTSYFTADLSWPDADDDIGVTAYQVFADGKQVSVVDGFSTSYQVSGLTPGTSHTFGVRAIDFPGHQSAELTATGETTAVARTRVIDSVSVLPDGRPSSTSSTNPSVSADGRYVAFVGTSSCFANPFDGDGSLLSQQQLSCYQDGQTLVRDREAGTTTLLSHVVGEPAVPPAGPYDSTSDVAISGDGSEVAFISEGDNLVAGDTNQVADLFVADRATAQVHAVSIPDLGAPIAQVSEQRGISMDANGTHVAFVAEDSGGTSTYVVVEDWRAGTATLVPVPAGTYDVQEPELSSDGSRLAFVAVLPDAQSQVVVVNLADPSTPLFTRVIGDQQYYAYDNRTLEPRISLSADGRFIAYPAPVAFQLSDLQVQDLSDLTKTPANITNPTQPNCDTTTDACYDMGAPALSADGSTIVFDPMTPQGSHTLYQASPVDGTATPIAVLPDGTTDNRGPGDRTPAITADGTGVVFQSNNASLAQLTTGSDIVYEHDPNSVAPSFAGGAALAADNLTGSQVRLSWPAATDDHVVIGYRVTQDGKTVADLDPTARSFTATGLTAGGTYHFAVSGVDAALNVGTPLSLDVTTPGGSQPPGQAPLAVDASAGGGHATLTWDPSSDPTVTGYRVLRGTGDTGALTAIADVDGAAAGSFTDSGLAASTTYRYEVHTLGSTGEQNYTVTTSVTTPDLSAATLSFTTPFVDGARAAKLGADLTLTVHGGPSLTGSATVAYTKADATTDTAQVTLTETASGSGVYTGKFNLAEGIASIDGVTASLSDGAGHSSSATATGLPLPVSGALKVTIDAPASGSVDGAKLSVLSAAIDTGAQQTVNGNQTVTLPLAASSDYDLTLTEPATYTAVPNYKVIEQSGLVIAAGTTSSITLQPTLPAFLNVLVTPVNNAQVDVYDSDGALIGTKTGADAGAMDAFGPVPAGTKVHIDSTVLSDGSAVLKHAERDVSLAAGENEVTINHALLPTGTVSGKLTVSGGAPSFGANLTFTETVDGRPWTFHATPARDGSYSVGVLAGDVTVNATAYNAIPGSKTVTVAAGATAAADIDLVGPRQYQLTLGLTTVEPDGTRTTLPVDWRTGVHFQVHVYGPRFDSSGWGGAIAPTITVTGLPGDVYNMCANGAQAGLPAACDSVTLGTDSAVNLSVVLTGGGRVTGTLLGADGAPFTGHWTAYVYQLLDGQRRSIDNALGSGSAVSIDVPSSGDYEVDFSGDGGVVARPVLATVNGSVVDVGQIPLARNSAFGGVGNDVVAASSQITPGQVAEFRASYAYNGGTTTGAIRLGIPAGTTLVPGSVTLDGQALADPSISGGYALVPLASLPSGATGVVHYAVATTPSTPAGPLTSIVRMSYGASGDTLIGSATTTVVGVTLAAPSQIKGLTAELTGQAPAGATVDLYDEFGQLVGSAVATEGGLWSANVTLADRGESYHYTLQAVTTVNGATLRSDTQRVTHDSHTVVPTMLALSQPDGREVDFDPSSGVARFPYVFVPGMGLNVSACFPAGTTVSDMSARVGPQLHGSTAVGVLYGSASLANVAPRSNSALIAANATPASIDSATLVGGSGGNCYSAHLNPSISQLGAVYLDYTAAPAPFNAADLAPPSGALEQRLPPVFAGRSGDQVATNGDGSQTFTTNLPSIDGSVSITGSTRTIDYAPTADDLASAAQSGVPVYGLTQSVSGSGDSVNASIRVVIPQSWLQDYLPSGQGAVAPGAGGTAKSNALIRPNDIVIPVEKAIEVTINMYGNGHSILDSLGAGGPYDQLSALLDDVDNSSCADEADKANLRNYLSNVAKNVRNQQIASGVLTVFGAVVGFGLGPIGSAIVGIAIDKLMDAAQDKMLRDAAKLVHDDLNFCENDTQVDEIADPDWVIDPSGYTYEAVTSNRLADVTATLLKSDSPDGPFTVWDAAAYGQQNPLTTDAQGKYGWNVPFGYWKVAYSKPGYETAYSQVFQIPPPRFDVNVGLTRIAAPTVTLTRATSGSASSVTVGFDDYMDVATVTGRLTIVDGNGNPISGTVQPVDPQAAPDGKQLAKTFRFAPDQPFADDAALTVNVDELVRDYAGHTLDAAFSQAVTTTAPATPAPVTDVRAFAIDAHTFRVEWTTSADDGGSPLTGVQVTASNGAALDLAPDATSATIDNLSPQTDYTVAVAAVNAVGAGPAQSTMVTTPPLTMEEAFGAFRAPPNIDGGSTVQGSVSVPGVSSSDTTYALTSDSSVASVPRSVTVAAGSASASFDISTTNPVVDTDVEISASNGGVTLTAPVTVNHVDVALQATASASGVALSWPAASDSDLTGYRVMRAAGDGAFTALADVDASTTSDSDPTASAGTTYHYQVLAVLPNDNAQPWSAVADVNTPVRLVTMSVTTSPVAPVDGDDVTVNVAVMPADAGADVDVAEGGTTIGSAQVDASGDAAIVLRGLAVGVHHLAVTYAGGPTTAPASGSIDVTVTAVQHQPVATKLTVDPLRSLWDLLLLALGRYQVTAHLTRADNGAGIAGQQVVIDSWAGQFCTATTDASGTASCPVPPRLTSIVLLGQVHASFAGSADYLPSAYGSDARPGRGRF